MAMKTLSALDVLRDRTRPDIASLMSDLESQIDLGRSSLMRIPAQYLDNYVQVQRMAYDENRQPTDVTPALEEGNARSSIQSQVQTAKQALVAAQSIMERLKAITGQIQLPGRAAPFHGAAPDNGAVINNNYLILPKLTSALSDLIVSRDNMATCTQLLRCLASGLVFRIHQQNISMLCYFDLVSGVSTAGFSKAGIYKVTAVECDYSTGSFMGKGWTAYVLMGIAPSTSSGTGGGPRTKFMHVLLEEGIHGTTEGLQISADFEQILTNISTEVEVSEDDLLMLGGTTLYNNDSEYTTVTNLLNAWLMPKFNHSVDPATPWYIEDAAYQEQLCLEIGDIPAVSVGVPLTSIYNDAVTELNGDIALVSNFLQGNS